MARSKKTTREPSKMVRVDEAMEILSVSKSTAYDTIQNGERGEACATILVDDAQAWALQAAFSGKDHTKAGYFLRERGIGFCWSCEHLRGRGYVENSIKSVKVEEA